MEDKLKNLPHLESKVKEYEYKIDLIMELLGEKEEEVEGLTADIQEVKNLYKSYIEQLLTQILPEDSNRENQNLPANPPDLDIKNP